MVTRIRQFLASPVFEGDEDKTRTAGLVNMILLALIALLTLVSLIVAVTLRIYAMMGGLFVSMMLPMLIALWIVRRGHARAAAWIMVSALWLVLVVSGAFIGGVVNAGYTTVILVIIVAALLLGGRGGVLVAAVSIVAVIVVYSLEMFGLLPPPVRADDPTSFFINHVLNYVMAGALLYLTMRNLTAALQRARRLTAESEGQKEQLQLLLQQRTRDAERNANYLQATMAVARETAAALGDLQALLARVVDVTREQFDLYHVGLYLLDEAGEWAELRAVSGAGQELLARGFRLRVGAGGMVGDVALRGVYRLAIDVDQEPAYLRIAELPDASSELTLPLTIRDQVIGVLDAQHAGAREFVMQSAQTLQALADQVAMAISNARLVQQVQRAAEMQRRAYGELTGEAWTTMLRTSQALGFYSNAQTTAPAGDLWQPEMKTALQTGNTVHDAPASPQDARRLAVPVKVRGEVIGVIDFAKPVAGSVWATEEIALVEALTEQLGVALDSARLYQESQRAAIREQLFGQVSGRIRQELDLEAVLKTTVDQIQEVLGLERATIRLVRDVAQDKG